MLGCSSAKMLEKEIEKDVTDLVAEVLSLENISVNSSQLNIAEWDSMAYLSNVARLEDEISLEISQENINNFGSVLDIMKEVVKWKNKLL